MKPVLLVLTFVADEHREQLARHYDVVYAPDAAQAASAIAARGPDVRAVLTIGSVGLTAAQIDALPALGFVSALGAGYENIDVAHARTRGIALANGTGTNDACVADHAFGLLLAVLRRIPQLDRLTREGVWRTELPILPNVSGKKLGILGLGAIGRKVAQRGLGFDMPVGYHSRTARADAPYRYFAKVAGLAQWADILVIATPGGPSTRHLIDAAVIDALGPQGFLVNIARGSVVDTAALAAALRDGRLAGAGLDVYESEPAPPAELIGLDNVVLTPHVAGWSPEAIQAAFDRFLENARRHFAGEPLVSPI